MESTAPTTGPRAAAHGIADFKEKLRYPPYELMNPTTYTWTDSGTGKVVTIQPLDFTNIQQWIDLSLKDQHAFNPTQTYDEKVRERRMLLGDMIQYALDINGHRAAAANLDQQYQAAQTAYNIGEQGERNRITFMNHDQLIQDLAAKGFNTQSSAISSANDGQLRKMLWDQLGPLKRGGRRRKTKKSKRRTRSTRSARKTRRARK